MKIHPIETERLILRGFEKMDAGFAFSIWNDPEMGEYLPDEAQTEMSDETRKEYEALGDDADCCYLVAVRKADGIRVGTCSFMPLEDGSTYDIAYCVHKAYWRRGYATEMANGMIAYARERHARRVTIRINQENVASNAIAAKLGCKIIGEKRYLKRGTNLEFADHLYELAL